MGDILQEEGSAAAALEAFQKGGVLLEILAHDPPSLSPLQSLLPEPQAGDTPARTHFERRLALTSYAIGQLLYAQGRSAEALRAYTKAHGLMEKLAREHPSVAVWRADLAHPAVVQFQYELAGTERNLGVVLLVLGSLAESLRGHEQARDRLARLVEAPPAVL